jgi:nucleoside-diphosphate-sugar epimerase
MQRLLIIGCGDMALRVAPLLKGRFRLFGLVRDPARAPQLRAAGITPVPGDLDHPASLWRLAGLAHWILHLAPPPATGRRDGRTRHLLAALGRRGTIPQALVYISTTGVYGDAGGAWLDETAPLRPQVDRGRRRLDAERRLRRWATETAARVSILRVPGIYAGDRLPLARLRQGAVALAPDEDGYTNHIHADDLACILKLALFRGRPNRAYNASDGAPMTMGDYFDAVARRFGLPAVTRLPLAEAAGRVSLEMLSYLRDSRRIGNRRLREELRVGLKYRSVNEFLNQHEPQS